jgi:uncharacterized MnhB-related membrane protein
MAAMTLLPLAPDLLLGVALLFTAWRALYTRALFPAVVFFVAFGMLLALAWMRLEAPDVALAEAAIGAGLTGALLMAAVARLRGRDEDRP